jgi:aryl-alcohol dehydrogenase-like predicted oxidoreductase
MDYHRLGSSGLRVSRIALGMLGIGQAARSSPAWSPWHLDVDRARPIVARAAELGVTYFDTADAYSDGESERTTGALLREVFSRREDYVVATKVWFRTGPGPNDAGLSRSHIIAGIDASLRRLGLDYVDLYQIHRWDEHTPIEETMQALHDVVRAGKARYLGASSMRSWRFAKAQSVARAHGWTPFVSMQSLYNLAYREEEQEMIPLCLDEGVGVLAYSPLSRGLLVGTRDRDGTAHTERAHNDPVALERFGEAGWDIADAVRRIAERYDRPPAQIALSWLLSRPAVVAPIVGAADVSHVDQAVAALDLVLSDKDIAILEAPYRPRTPINV